MASIFLSVSLAKSHSIVALSFLTTACDHKFIPFLHMCVCVWCIVMLADPPMHVPPNSVVPVFVFSRTYYMTPRYQMIYCLMVLVTHPTLGFSTIFYYSCLIIPGEKALVLCSHDESFSITFQIHKCSHWWGFAWTTSAGWLCWGYQPCQGLFSQVWFSCLISSFLAYLLIPFACMIQKAASFVLSWISSSCQNLLK